MSRMTHRFRSLERIAFGGALLGFASCSLLVFASSCSTTHDRAGLEVRPIFGRPAPWLPAPELGRADPIPPPTAPERRAPRDCDDVCSSRGLVCIAEGLCAEATVHDTELAANAGRYAVAPLGDPSRPDGVVLAYHEYLWSSASDDRSFLHVGVLGARDGSFAEIASQRLPPTNWTLFDVAAGGPPEDRRVLAAWQDEGVRLASYDASGTARVVTVSTHPTENVLDVVGTPTGGVVADGEPGDYPRISPRLYRIDRNGGVLDMRTASTWDGTSMLDRNGGATLVAAPDGGVALAYVRRSIDPADASSAIELLRDRNSLGEVERVSLRPDDGNPIEAIYEPLRAWPLANTGRVLIALAQPTDAGTRARLATSPLHVGTGDALSLGPTLDDRPDDIATVSIDGIDYAVSVTLRTEADDELVGCEPPRLERSEVVVRAIDLGALAYSGDAVVVERRDAEAGEWELQSAPRVVALGDGTAGFVVLWLDSGTIRHRRFQLLVADVPPPVPGS